MRIGLFEGPGAGRPIRPGVVTDAGEPEPEGGWQNGVPAAWESRSNHG